MSIEYTLGADGVGHVLINRPERMNALDVPAKEALGKIWRDACADPLCKVLVISGAGDKAFCAGSDIKEMQSTGEMASTETLMNAIPGVGIELHKPVVAALHGFTVGMGMTLAIHSDFRIATKNARFAFPEVKHGMLSGVSAVTLPGIVGEHAALDIMLSGRVFEAAEALKLGLLSSVVDGVSAQDVLVAARSLATKLAANSMLALGLTKRLVLLERRRKILEHAAEIDSARREVTRSAEFTDVVQRKQGAGRMQRED